MDNKDNKDVFNAGHKRESALSRSQVSEKVEGGNLIHETLKVISTIRVVLNFSP